MTRPNVSQKNFAQSITLPRPACLPPIVHPGVMCSPGKWRACTQLSMWWRGKKAQFLRPGHLIPYLFCPVFMLQHGHPHWSVAMQPHTQQLCTVYSNTFPLESALIWNLITSCLPVGLDLRGQLWLPTCINEVWPPVTLSLVHHCSFLGPLVIDTDNCSLGTPLKTPSQLAITLWPLSISLKSSLSPIFTAAYTSTLRTKC